MSDGELTHQVDAFVTWKKGIIKELTRYRTWLKDNQLSTDDIDERLNLAQGSLQSDKITLAFVGEFSRGKTELINALFFAQYGQRLMPSGPGRTTMCPTELFFDLQTRESYIRLLPVETRKDNETIKQLKGRPNTWKYIPLDLANTDKIAAAFREVASTKTVPGEEAIALGFQLESLEPCPDNPSQVMIPAWRHALISFEHPLLRQGLTIIDTPGLNALGCEPELTFSLLPEAHAVLFMLSADTGVTQTDLVIWQNHIRELCGHMNANMYAVLNKTDLLWDDPEGEEAEKRHIRQITRSTATQLGIPDTGILPLSAKKGLTGKILCDTDILMKSQLPKLEKLLSESIVTGKERAIQESIVNDVINMLLNSRRLLKNRVDELKSQKNLLQSDLTDKHQTFRDLNEKTKKDQSHYHKKLLLLKSSRNMMQKQAPLMVSTVNPAQLDLYLAEVHKTLGSSWSNRGINKAVDAFYDAIRNDLLELKGEYTKAEKMVSEVYQQYQEHHPDETFELPQLDVDKHLNRLEELRIQAGKFQKNLLNMFRDQKNLSKRFANTVSHEATNLYKLAHNDARIWCKNAFTPILRHAQEQKKLLDEQLTTIKSMANSGSSTKDQVKKLQNMSSKLEKQLVQADSILRALRKPAPSVMSQKVVPLGNSPA